MPETKQNTPGKLVYLMGASGSGKDTLLQAIERIPGLRDRLLIAQRYITRKSRENCEQHIPLGMHDFVQREREGEFLFNWQAHGYHYGVGHEVLHALEQGRCVLMNGSRRYLQTARDIYPDLIPVALEVKPEVLRKRLAARGRENENQISARLQRARDYAHSIPADALRIGNNEGIETAVRALLESLGLHSLAERVDSPLNS